MGADVAGFITSAVGGGADAVKTIVKGFEEIGADELILNPTSDEIGRLAEIVL